MVLAKGRARRLVPVLLVLAGVVFVACWWFFGHHVPALRRAEVERWRGRLTAMAEDRQVAIDGWMTHGLADARTIASYPTLRAHLQGGPIPPGDPGLGGPDHLTRLLTDAVEQHGMRGCMVVTGSGEQLVHVGPPPAPASHEVARSALSARNTRVRVVADGDRGATVLFVAPVLAGGGAGAALGAVALDQDPEVFLYPLLRSEPLPTATGETMLAQPAGDRIEFVHATRRGGFSPLELRRPFDAPDLAMRHALAREETFGEFVDYLGVPVLAATRHLDRASWGLVVKVDLAEALAPYRERRLRHLVSGVAMLLGVSGLGLAGYRALRSAHARELHAAEERKRELEQALGALFQSSAIGMVFGDVEGRVFEANDAFLALVGRAREEFRQGALRWTDLTAPEHRSRDRAAVVEARERGMCTPFEKAYARPDGSRVHALVGFTLIEPERVKTVAFVLDLTRRLEAEEEVRRLNAELEARVRERTRELEEANRELEAFAYSVSHDLRTPLRALEGFARILEEDHASSLSPEGLRLVRVIQDNARRMTRLVGDLLTLSRAGRQSIRWEPVDMGSLARQAFAELAEVEPLRGVELRIAPLGAATGDAGLLKQVWSNLLGNALKFTRPKPRRVIDVECRRLGAAVEYLVRDNGVGFDMRHAERLFGVFQRLHPEEEFEGTGAGLAVVRRIVERHGGTVEAEGRAGEGACVRFTLPDPDAPA